MDRYVEIFANATRVVMTGALKHEVVPRHFLSVVGFGPLGPIAGSWAAWIQSLYSNVPAGRIFTFFQRLGMTYGSAWAPRWFSLFFGEFLWKIPGAFSSFVPSWFGDIFTSWMPAFFQNLRVRLGGAGLGMGYVGDLFVYHVFVLGS